MFDRKTLVIGIGIEASKAFLVVVLAFAVIGLFKFRIDKIISGLAQQRSNAFVLERRADTIRNLGNDLSKTGNHEADIVEAYPPADNVVDFKSALDNLAAKQALTGSVQIGTLSGDQKSLGYTISLNANIDTLINYLGDFEKLPYFTGISSIDFHSPAADWQGNSDISMQAAVHTRPVSDN